MTERTPVARPADSPLPRVGDPIVITDHARGDAEPDSFPDVYGRVGIVLAEEDGNGNILVDVPGYTSPDDPWSRWYVGAWVVPRIHLGCLVADFGFRNTLRHTPELTSRPLPDPDALVRARRDDGRWGIGVVEDRHTNHQQYPVRVTYGAESGWVNGWIELAPGGRERQFVEGPHLQSEGSRAASGATVTMSPSRGLRVQTPEQAAEDVSELDAFKRAVYDKAMALAREHDWCGVVGDALRDLGIEGPKTTRRRIAVVTHTVYDIEVDTDFDIRGTLATLIRSGPEVLPPLRVPTVEAVDGVHSARIEGQVQLVSTDDAPTPF